MSERTTPAGLTARAVVRLWLVQVLGTLALIVTAYSWLLWPDERTWQVVFSLMAALLLVVLGLWLECATLAFFALPAASVSAGFRRSTLKVPAFFTWMLAFMIIQRLLHGIRGGVPQAGVRAAQVIPVGPRPAMSALDWLVLILEWIVVPALMLPIAAEISTRGFSAWRPAAIRRAMRRLRQATYWVAYFVAVLVGAYVPSRLMGMVPAPSTLAREVLSLGWRVTMAYLLTVSTWVAFAWILGRTGSAEPATASSSAKAEKLSGRSVSCNHW